MIRATLGRMGGAAALMVGAAVIGAPTPAVAQTAPTFTKDVAPIFQRKCEACHRPDSIAPMSLVTYQQARPWARSIKARVSEHSMPPFQIDKTVGVTKFKNDDSLSDAELATIVKWVDAGAPQGDPKDLPPAVDWPDDQGWNFAKAFGQAEPDLVIKSHSFTMPAQAQDAWDERVTESGSPAALGAGDRDPAEHAEGPQDHPPRDAYLQQEDPNAPPTGFLPVPFMEWAVGKQGEMMRPDTGKLLLPGSKFRWDIHYSQAGEEITSDVEMGIYFYPKGQEPEVPQQPVAGAGGAGHARHPAEHHHRVGGLLPAARQRADRELPAAHAPARQGDDGRSGAADRPAPGVEPRRQLQLPVDDDVRLRRRRRAAAAEGHAAQGHGVARQHDGQEEQPRPEPVGGLGRPHRRRDGPRLDQHRLPQGRRVQGGAGASQDDDQRDDGRPPIGGAPAEAASAAGPIDPTTPDAATASGVAVLWRSTSTLRAVPTSKSTYVE